MVYWGGDLMDDKYLLAVICVMSLVVLEGMALLCGMNGDILRIVISAISGIFGLALGIKLSSKKTPTDTK